MIAWKKQSMKTTELHLPKSVDLNPSLELIKSRFYNERRSPKFSWLGAAFEELISEWNHRL